MSETAFGKWQPIETAPKDGRPVLLVGSKGYAVCQYDNGAYSNNPIVLALAGKSGYWKYAGSAAGYIDPVLWMPLPPPPSPTTQTEE